MTSLKTKSAFCYLFLKDIKVYKLFDLLFFYQYFFFTQSLHNTVNKTKDKKVMAQKLTRRKNKRCNATRHIVQIISTRVTLVLSQNPGENTEYISARKSREKNKFSSESVNVLLQKCHCNSSETTQQNFMKLCR